jgi:hypothetical protein
MEHRIFLSPLTEAEKTQLRKQRFKNTKMIGFGFAFMCLPILALAKHIPNDVLISLVTILVITFSSIAGMLVFVFGDAPLFKKDLDSNRKTVIKGIIDDKIQEEVRSSGSAGQLGNDYYYFVIAGKKVKVSWLQYYAFRIGEHIEIHIGTNSDWILGIERKSAMLPLDYSYRVLIDTLTVSEKVGMAFRIVFVTVIASVFVFAFGYIAYNTYPENWGFSIPAGLLAIAITGLVLYFLIYKYTVAIILGKKEIVEGTLRGKEWKSNDYYFILGDQKFGVGNRRFKTPQVGESIRVIRLSNGDILDWNFA